jgi:hypothetical protein
MIFLRTRFLFLRILVDSFWKIRSTGRRCDRHKRKEKDDTGLHGHLLCDGCMMMIRKVVAGRIVITQNKNNDTSTFFSRLQRRTQVSRPPGAQDTLN